VEAICALPHPVPTHSLASSFCLTHLLTGSDDGYIRDYDIFSAVNGKVFLSAQQRHHSGVVEGLMKSGQIRAWWENPMITPANANAIENDEPGLAPVYSMTMHSDALWMLAGSDVGFPAFLMVSTLR
jgi:transcriptional activator SPT8